MIWWIFFFFFFFWLELGILINYELIRLLQNVLALSKANRVSTTDGGSTKTTKMYDFLHHTFPTSMLWNDFLWKKGKINLFATMLWMINNLVWRNLLLINNKVYHISQVVPFAIQIHEDFYWTLPHYITNILWS